MKILLLLLILSSCSNSPRVSDLYLNDTELKDNEVTRDIVGSYLGRFCLYNYDEMVNIGIPNLSENCKAFWYFTNNHAY